MRHLIIALALAAASVTLAGCGGGGGGGEPAPPQVIDLGVVPANATTATTFTVGNGTGFDGTLTNVSLPGPFGIDPGHLLAATVMSAPAARSPSSEPAGSANHRWSTHSSVTSCWRSARFAVPMRRAATPQRPENSSFCPTAPACCSVHGSADSCTS